MINAIDHLVLTVRDIDASVAFYTRVLGMRHVVFGEGRHALVFGDQKINLHPAGREYMPAAARPTPGAADVCLLCAGPLEVVIDHLKFEGIHQVEKVVVRAGARGRIRSIYIRDPDGNLLELSSYVDHPGPQVAQPAFKGRVSNPR
ncbi:MAG TPA: VOC family protein [Kiritimatiellia bacterium]|nr:VOC family protein [Kiritimatiellia bacterium]HMP00374.1 VOC family protein [Kiritimatiellia bacterium]